MGHFLSRPVVHSATELGSLDTAIENHIFSGIPSSTSLSMNVIKLYMINSHSGLHVTHRLTLCCWYIFSYTYKINYLSWATDASCLSHELIF